MPKTYTVYVQPDKHLVSTKVRSFSSKQQATKYIKTKLPHYVTAYIEEN